MNHNGVTWTYPADRVNAGKRWDLTDNLHLADLLDHGVSLPEVARLLGRTERAVRRYLKQREGAGQRYVAVTVPAELVPAISAFLLALGAEQ
ncbi:helix-turn-helix domain-containing protein [Kitasatospora sp. NPDC098663]|uniref:helix-turn-helix domain-containing protein n=1 Tax=Kitasatospora sp. NPDC098663 TaxID=3364096 RepID=UPI003800F694